jgi:two-component system LytT family response regulator
MNKDDALTYYMLDDEELSRMRLRSLLEESSFEMREAGEHENPVSAIAEIMETSPDVLFLDIQMPKLDGFDVAEALGDQLPHVIFVTAYDEYAIRAFDLHALDYLTKPVRLERLEKALHRLKSIMEIDR